MLKLQDQLSKKRGDKEYRKFIINIPVDIVEEVGWKGGQEITVRVMNKNKLLLTRKKETKN